MLAKSSVRPFLCVDARYLAEISLNLDGLGTLEQHKEPGFHLYSVVRYEIGHRSEVETCHMNDTAAQIITFAPPHRSISLMQQAASLSF